MNGQLFISSEGDVYVLLEEGKGKWMALHIPSGEPWAGAPQALRKATDGLKPLGMTLNRWSSAGAMLKLRRAASDVLRERFNYTGKKKGT